MNRDDRNRLARLEQILNRLESAEKDALFRLRSEGWNFRSVEAAKAQLRLIREQARSQAVSVVRMAELIGPGRKQS